MATKKSSTTRAKTTKAKKSSSAKTTRTTAKVTASKKVANKQTVNKKTTTGKVSEATWLKRGNAILAALFAVGAGAVLLLGNGYSLAVNSLYLAENKLAETGSESLLPAIRDLFSVNLQYVVAAFLLTGAVSHLLLATYRQKRYSQEVAVGKHTLRTLLFAVSTVVLVLTVGLLVGVRDIMSLLMLAALGAGSQLWPLFVTRYKDSVSASGWLTKKAALDATILPWLVIGVYVLHSYIYGLVDLSLSLFGILAVAFVGSLLFIANTVLQPGKVGGISRYITGEKSFLVLSLLVHGGLGLLIFVSYLS